MLARLAIASILVAAVSFSAYAREYPEGPASDIPITIYESQIAVAARDMNTTLTFDPVETRGYRFLTLLFDYVRGAGSAVTMTCKTADSLSGTYRDIQVLTFSGSTASSAQMTWSNAVSGNESWPWTLTLNGYGWTKCTVACTGSNPNDLLTITGVLGN